MPLVKNTGNLIINKINVRSKENYKSCDKGNYRCTGITKIGIKRELLLTKNSEEISKNNSDAFMKFNTR